VQVLVRQGYGPADGDAAVIDESLAGKARLGRRLDSVMEKAAAVLGTLLSRTIFPNIFSVRSDPRLDAGVGSYLEIFATVLRAPSSRPGIDTRRMLAAENSGGSTERGRVAAWVHLPSGPLLRLLATGAQITHDPQWPGSAASGFMVISAAARGRVIASVETDDSCFPAQIGCEWPPRPLYRHTHSNYDTT